MTNEMMKKAQELFESEAFGKEIETCETVEELQKVLGTHGVEISLEETEQICIGIASAQKDELTENDLDGVSGGIGILGAIAVTAAVWGVSYIAGYVTGKILKKKTGACY